MLQIDSVTLMNTLLELGFRPCHSNFKTYLPKKHFLKLTSVILYEGFHGEISLENT